MLPSASIPRMTISRRTSRSRRSAVITKPDQLSATAFRGDPAFLLRKASAANDSADQAGAVGSVVFAVAPDRPEFANSERLPISWILQDVGPASSPGIRKKLSAAKTILSPS